MRPLDAAGTVPGSADTVMSAATPRSLRSHLLTSAKLLILGIALVVVAAISAYLTVRRAVAGRDVLVPDLSGMTSDEAREILRKQGLMLEQVSERHDPHVEPGRVLVQEPPPGSSIKVDRKIKVVLSLGDTGGAIPEVRGAAARGAQITLQQQGLHVADPIYAYTSKESENLVVGQDPLAGEFGLKEGRVTLLVSRGRRPVVYVMPDLTGRREAEVLRFLTRAGLRPAPTRHESSPSGAASGTIVAQRPEAGYPVRAGDLVTLTVAGDNQGGSDD